MGRQREEERTLLRQNEAERDDQPTEPIDEASYGASAAESGGVYNQDGPNATNADGDTMGSRDEAPPGEDPESDPYSGDGLGGMDPRRSTAYRPIDGGIDDVRAVH